MTDRSKRPLARIPHATRNASVAREPHVKQSSVRPPTRKSAPMKTAARLQSDERTPTPFAKMLRQWRDRRKCSQLELALDANVSQRHLSFLESGRAQPSREMILQLAEVLDIPLRERNLLLNAAGFAPVFHHRTLQDDEMAAVRHALELTLQHHEPFPALVVNRDWNMVMRNQAADRFISLLGDPETVWKNIDSSGNYNVMRMTFHPKGMQPLLKNWSQVSTVLLSRLQREVAADPGNEGLRHLFEDICAFPGIPEHWRSQDWTTIPAPILPLELGLGSQVLKVFSMISTFGTALDITAEELRVETFFPSDDFSRNFFSALALQAKH